MSDADLVRQAAAGQAGAFEELVRRWAGRITALCHARVRRADVAEDLAQETLLRSFRSLNSLAQPEKFGGWVLGIAHRACLDWLKAKERTTIPFSALGANAGSVDAVARDDGVEDAPLEKAEEVRHLMAQVEALPAEYREVVMLYYYQEVTYRDLAQLLGIAPATVNARLTKARAMLRTRMEGARR